ncbi:MAG: HAD-IA family hydrolase, partial [Candidatus Limnocylindrales bacterium]
MPRVRRLPVAALFDWDGTIVDTIPLIYRANVVALREIGVVLTREWYRDRYTPDWRQSYTDLGVPEHLWDAVATRWAQEMAAGRPRALPWARPALRRLRRHGIRVGLVTASTRAVVEPNLRRLSLDGVFETIRCSDDVERSKPHPDALLEALDELGVVAAR